MRKVISVKTDTPASAKELAERILKLLNIRDHFSDDLIAVKYDESRWTASIVFFEDETENS